MDPANGILPVITGKALIEQNKKIIFDISHMLETSRYINIYIRVIFILVLTLSNGLLECSSFISSAISRKDQNMDSVK